VEAEIRTYYKVSDCPLLLRNELFFIISRGPDTFPGFISDVGCLWRNQGWDNYFEFLRCAGSFSVQVSIVSRVFSNSFYIHILLLLLFNYLFKKVVDTVDSMDILGKVIEKQ